MIKPEGILKNLENLIGRPLNGSEFSDEVICAFEDFEVNGEDYVVINTRCYSNYDTIAYINHEASPQNCMITHEEGNGIFFIDNVWMA